MGACYSENLRYTINIKFICTYYYIYLKHIILGRKGIIYRISPEIFYIKNVLYTEIDINI